MRRVRLCVGKGRGAAEVFRLLRQSGIEVPADFRDERRLVVPEPGTGLTLVLARHADLPWLLVSGRVEVAIGSNSWFLNADDPRLMCVRGLGIARCRLSLLVPESDPHRRIRSVCTCYPNLARRFVPGARIVQLVGCEEIATALGIADAVVAVVETGETCCAMQLREKQVLMKFEHSVWTSRERMPLVEDMVDRIPGLARLLGARGAGLQTRVVSSHYRGWTPPLV